MLSIMGNLLYWLKLIDQNNSSPTFLWLLHPSCPRSFGIQFSSKLLPTRFFFGLTFIDSGVVCELGSVSIDLYLSLCKIIYINK